MDRTNNTNINKFINNKILNNINIPKWIQMFNLMTINSNNNNKDITINKMLKLILNNIIM